MIKLNNSMNYNKTLEEENKSLQDKLIVSYNMVNELTVNKEKNESNKDLKKTVKILESKLMQQNDD